MNKLYELTNDITKLMDLDMSPEDIADTLESLQMEFNDKAVNICKLDRMLDGNIESVNAEIARLTNIKKAITSRKDSIKGYLLRNMMATGVSKIECPLFKISLREPVKVADVFDLDLVPDDYVTTEVVVKADKREMLKQLKAGVDIPGAKISEGKAGLIIK